MLFRSQEGRQRERKRKGDRGDFERLREKEGQESRKRERVEEVL